MLDPTNILIHVVGTKISLSFVSCIHPLMMMSHILIWSDLISPPITCKNNHSFYMLQMLRSWHRLMRQKKQVVYLLMQTYLVCCKNKVVSKTCFFVFVFCFFLVLLSCQEERSEKKKKKIPFWLSSLCAELHVRSPSPKISDVFNLSLSKLYHPSSYHHERKG